MLARAFLALTGGFLSFSIFAKTVHLYTAKGTPIENYNEVLQGLQPDDELFFNGGKVRFRFLSVAGNGATTQVLKVFSEKDGLLALRLPIWLDSKSNAKYYLNSFVKGLKKLETAGIPTPKVVTNIKNEAIAVEFIEKAFDLSDFFLTPSQIDASTLEEAENALYTFARKTAVLKEIGDFHEEQLVYSKDRKEWVVLDVEDAHHFSGLNKANILDKVFDNFSPYSGPARAPKDLASENLESPEIGVFERRMFEQVTKRHQKIKNNTPIQWLRIQKIRAKIKEVIAEERKKPSYRIKQCSILFKWLGTNLGLRPNP